MDPARRTDRLLAQMLDGVIAVLPLLAAVLAFRVSETLATFVFLAALLVSVGYYFLADALPGGQSYGKRALGIRVIDERTSQPCSLTQSLVRNLLLAVLGPIDWLFIFGATHQRLGDMAAHTVVVPAADELNEL